MFSSLNVRTPGKFLSVSLYLCMYHIYTLVHFICKMTDFCELLWVQFGKHLLQSRWRGFLGLVYPLKLLLVVVLVEIRFIEKTKRGKHLFLVAKKKKKEKIWNFLIDTYTRLWVWKTVYVYKLIIILYSYWQFVGVHIQGSRHCTVELVVCIHTYIYIT